MLKCIRYLLGFYRLILKDVCDCGCLFKYWLMVKFIVMGVYEVERVVVKRN